MCSDQLDSGSDALLKRIAALEAKISSVESFENQKPAATEPEKAAPVIKEPVKPENEKISFDESKAEKSDIQPENPISENTEKNEAPTSSSDTEPFTKWAEVMN